MNDSVKQKGNSEGRKSHTFYGELGSAKTKSNAIEIPSINLPKGGGAIKGIDEKFQVNAISGTSSFSIPIPLSPNRHGFISAIGLSYNSGNGNSPFGIGWEVDIPAIIRKTEKQLPQYKDHEESDVFVLSGAEDLVPLLEKNGKKWKKTQTEDGKTYIVSRYIPRIEGLFARIEKWENNNGETHWRTVSKDNIHSYYGITEESRITDPNDSSKTKIFKWLLCRVHDDKGNIIIYDYKKEDFKGIPKRLSEKNRINNCTQTYIKTILYGNKQPYYSSNPFSSESEFLFKVVFDYGEHDATPLIPKDIDQEKYNWDYRKDPFSSYRSGFEIRTYRRCKRIMMFHCFDQPELPHNPYLVNSLELFYDEKLNIKNNNTQIDGFSYLIKARQNGHKWDAISNHYTTKHIPDIEFTYQQHEWDINIKKVSPDNSTHAPMGIDHQQYSWVDLFSEGISGIITEKAGTWFYKSNLGNGNFSHAISVAPKPSLNKSPGSPIAIQELEGNGIKYLVQYDKEPCGFFKLTPDEEWESFKTFTSMPNIDFTNPNIRFIDLNGDGLADLLITEENVMCWYPGTGEKGFEKSEIIFKETNEEKGPTIIFSDTTQSIFLADMKGDGLTDIVRIKNGEISYWPNLGYGRFGAKVSMENSPLFDHPDTFNPAFLRLADIDGSGTTDIIYLGKNDFRVWMNLNGNAWTKEPQVIKAFPNINNLSDIGVLDFLGSGTACIVYSSSLPQNSQQPLQYIDLMGSKKPHLLTGYQNNCGKEVSIEYKSSTHFYLEDKKEGRKWITKLPFPVYCISKVRIEDKIQETVFTSSYRYSHGYFDHYEQEFRGFARVEQLDTEDFNQFKINTSKNVVEEALHQPPVRTVSWFHTGAFLGKDKILHQCQNEYFKNDQFVEYKIPEPFITDDITAEELREALRACKGLPLRSEVYANDNSITSKYPYTASQSTFEIRLIQSKQNNKYASFLIIPLESISYSYERNPADPRISHSFVLKADEFGNVEQSASVVYPRTKRPITPNDIPDRVWQEQNKLHIIYGEALYTDDLITDDVYRLRAGYESKSYELSGIILPVGYFFNKKDLDAKIKSASVIMYEQEFSTGIEKRLSGHGRSYFIKDDLSGSMPLGKISSLGIGYKSYQLAFTKNLVTNYYDSKVTDSMLIKAGYLHSEGDEHWWTQSGIAIYPDNPQNSFYTPIGARDVFGNEHYVEYDKYTFLVKSTTDAIGNKATAVSDYRTLSPVTLTDPNLNRAMVETDELGLVIKSAIMGKEGANEGDTLDDPTARMEYDLFNWQNNKKPNYVHMFAREQHGPANPRWQESYVYSDGGGSVIMTKVQAEPGKAKKWNSITKLVEEVDANPRWVGNGRTIINNKGNPVKQYEPYFSTTHEYESEDGLVETGVTPILYYDPLGRNIRTEYPNGTFSKIEFDAWYSKSFDVNDTIKDSQWYADRGSPDPVGTEPADPEQRAAWLAAKHYNTPMIAHTDSLGRSTYAVTDYGNGKTTHVYSESDLSNRYAKVFDQMGRCVAESYTNLLGTAIYGKTAEKGERWIFNDVMGRLVRTWDNNVRELWSTYDKLHRPVSTFVKEGGNETLFGHVVYGDIIPNAEQQNMKGRAYQLYDQAGVVTLKKVDFKGNVTEVERKLTKEYKQTINWQVLEGLTSITDIATNAQPLLENETFSSSSLLDALNRPTLVTLPDNSIVEPKYNEANFLDSLRVKIRGQGDFITFLENQDYDAKGQRQFAQYGNGLITNYFYDPKTFRLVNLVTTKAGGSSNQSLQNLYYTFDPVGNIVYSKDDAQQTNYFKNAVIRPESKFEYDAVYQLIKATGREHAGLGGNTQSDNNDLPYMAQLPHANDLNALRNYAEQYKYDDCGNILQLKHIADNANWTRNYRYEYQDDTNNKTNRLKSTSLPADPDVGPYTATYQHDIHGNMTKMPHLDEMVWNFMDQLAKVLLGGGGTAFYVYGMGGSRIRKVIERQGSQKTERIYLGAVEIYREYTNNIKKLERSTLHISDNTGKIAQVDTKTLDVDNTDPANPTNANLIRYQYANHLGSATMETDEHGTVISYEEYHPYGTSAYRNSKSDVDLSLKRYRFSGKERDDETGFYYFGARYYAAWLGRWTSSDPAGFVSGFNLFRYCSNNPIVHIDPDGMEDFNFCDMRILATGPDGKVGLYPHPSCVQTTPTTPATPSQPSRPTSPRPQAPRRRPTPSTTASSAPPSAPPANAPPAPSEAPPSPTPAATEAAVPPTTPSSTPSPEATTPPAVSPSVNSATQAGPALEKLIWNRNPFDRGYTLEHLYSNRYRDAYNATRDSRANYDVETPNEVKQIKSSEGTNATELRRHASRGTRDPGTAIAEHPTMTGKSPQAVVVTPTDAPASAGAEIRAGYDNIRKPVPNSVPPEHVRGLPGNAGSVGRGLTYGGTALSAGFLAWDLYKGDYSMAAADTLSTVGGGLEIYALSSAGATVAGVSAVSAGLVLGGAGMALGFGIGAVRDFQAKNYGWAAVGAVGALAGVAVVVGVIASAPALVVGGLIVGAVVGLAMLGRWVSSWF